MSDKISRLGVKFPKGPKLYSKIKVNFKLNSYNNTCQKTDRLKFRDFVHNTFDMTGDVLMDGSMDVQVY
jgi:hypothetical protein